MTTLKRLTLALTLLLAVPLLSRCQEGNTVMRQFAGVPTGSCANIQLAVNTLTGDLYNCLAGAWQKVNNTNFTSGGTMQGVWTAGPTYNISTVTETGNVVTVVTATTCPAITSANMSIVVSGVGIAGYNNGPGGLIGFFTTAACSGSTFTYFNPTSGLGSSSGGTVVVSPIFTQGLTHLGPETISGQLTMTNHNQIFWAGPGATPTIDQAVTACGTNPCIVEVSPLYTGADSANVFTTSLGYKVYNGANNVTIIDRRAVDLGAGNPTGTLLYGIMYGGRNAGALNRAAVNYYAHSPSDSSTGTNGFNWIDGTLPSNNGAQYGSISFATTHDTLTIGSSTSQVAGADAEAYHNATTVDKDLPYISGETAQSGISRANAVGNILTVAAHSANACANASTSGAKIENCYNYDAFRNTNGIAANYSLHGYATLWEASSKYDVVDGGFNISAASESSTTVTITTSATCNFLTGQKVRITGVGTTSFGYNGIWTVLTPGCNGGTTFTYTNTASGLATLGAGGIVAGIYTLLGPDASGNLIQTARSFTFNTPENTTRATVTSSGLFGVGTVGANTGGGAFLGGLGHEFAGLYMQETSAPSGSAGDTVCGGNSTTHTLQCSYNNGTVGNVDLTSNTSTTTTQVLHASATAGIGTYSAIATADIATALTTPGPIGGTTPSTGKFTTLTETNLLISNTAPTIAAAGCGGSAASISSNNGTASFNVFTGTAPTSGGCTITMPAAATSWNCSANHVSAISTTNFIIQQTGALSTTSVVLQLFSDVAAATAPTASDTWRVSCFAD